MSRVSKKTEQRRRELSAAGDREAAKLREARQQQLDAIQRAIDAKAAQQQPTRKPYVTFERDYDPRTDGKP